LILFCHVVDVVVVVMLGTGLPASINCHCYFTLIICLHSCCHDNIS